MGKRGPEPKSPDIKLLHGIRTDRVSPQLARNASGLPEFPSHLRGIAKDEWERIVPILDEMGVIGAGDGAIISLYCEAFADWLHAKEYLRKNGKQTKSAGGSFKLSPYVSIARQAAAECHRLLAELGLTPSARIHVAAKPSKKKSRLDDFMIG